MLKSELENKVKDLEKVIEMRDIADTDMRNAVTQTCKEAYDNNCSDAIPYIEEVCEVTGADEPTTTWRVSICIEVPVSRYDDFGINSMSDHTIVCQDGHHYTGSINDFEEV